MEEKILEILAEVCEDDVVKEDLDISLFDNDLLDSLSFVELLVEFEEKLNIVVSPSEVTREDMDTPNKIINEYKANILLGKIRFATGTANIDIPTPYQPIWVIPTSNDDKYEPFFQMTYGIILSYYYQFLTQYIPVFLQIYLI